MTSVLRDVRYGLRCWWHRPAFFITTVTTIAVAIAANTLIFALVRHVLLSPLPLPDPKQLVLIEETYPTAQGSSAAVCCSCRLYRSASIPHTSSRSTLRFRPPDTPTRLRTGSFTLGCWKI